jgi:hypothetical protein
MAEEGELRKCWRAHTQGADAKLHAQIDFEILNNGRTQNVKISQGGGDESFASCVTGIFANMVFLPFSGPSLVQSYPLEFE